MTDRLTVSEVARTLLSNAGQTGYESSVTLTRNAKGLTQFEVVVRDPDPNAAYRKGRELYDALEQLYPYPNGTKGENDA